MKIFKTATEAKKLGIVSSTKIITSQPGYRRGEKMMIAKTSSTGGVRLYVEVAGNWMDASLEDIKGIII